jgi:hypothetical protein
MAQRHANKVSQLILLALLFIGSCVAFTACGNDEPDTEVIDYYINVEGEFLVDGMTNHTDRYYDPVKRMRDAIRQAYPTPNAQGADDAVVKACDAEHTTFVNMYIGGSEHLTCLMHLMRVIKRGDVVRQSETLKTYVYDINADQIVE